MSELLAELAFNLDTHAGGETSNELPGILCYFCFSVVLQASSNVLICPKPSFVHFSSYFSHFFAWLNLWSRISMCIKSSAELRFYLFTSWAADGDRRRLFILPKAPVTFVWFLFFSLLFSVHLLALWQTALAAIWQDLLACLFFRANSKSLPSSFCLLPYAAACVLEDVMFINEAYQRHSHTLQPAGWASTKLS